VSHAAYLRNRAYTQALSNSTPEEKWSGVKPNVSHLQEFGAPVWILREDENLSKLDARSEKHTFVGFVDGPKVIKYYNERTRLIKISRNYRFLNNKLPNEAPNEGDTPSVQREGEKLEDTLKNGANESANENGSSVNQKRKRIENENIPLRQSKRAKTVHNYRILDDPYPEFAELANDPDEEQIKDSPAEIIYAAFNDCGIAPDDPKLIAMARKSPEWPEWEKAVHTELDQLERMKTWELVDPPEGRVPVGNKWVLVRKFNKQGELVKYKARLVAKGYSQIPGMDYTDTYSPVVRLETIRTILALAVTQDWEIQQMDVKGAYLNGILKEEVYMNQPEGYEDGTSRLCRLIKTLYGLKQSGREWNIELNNKLETKGFNRLYSDPCTYIRKSNGGVEIITVWVDDLLIFTNDPKLMNDLKKELQDMFEVTDLGDPNKIVGIEIERNREKGELKILQSKYIEAILERYGLSEANAVTTPLDPKVKLKPLTQTSEKGNRSNNYASLIGSLMYAAVGTRPDIAYAVYRLALYTADPNISHWTAAKRVLRYLKGMKDLGIVYKTQENKNENHFTGYSDASFANNDDRTSISGYTFISAGGAITWGSKKQNTVALSTTEAEYICLSDAAREAKWLQNLHMELGYNQSHPTLIYGDNAGSLAIAQNPRYHKRMKQFDIKDHYIRNQVKIGTIILKYCPTANMTADIQWLKKLSACFDVFHYL
jgi:hypothetical protein